MRIIFLLLSLMFLSSSLNSKDIWIYSDEGAWLDGIVAFEQLLSQMGESHKRVYADDLNNLSDYNNAKAIYFPGGYAYDYKVKLHNKTINNIRNYVATGGSYIGICAGAFFAASTVVWEGIEYPYSLGLFKGRAIGSIHKIASWDNYSMTAISLNQNNSIVANFKQEWNVLYYGGPYFESNESDFDVIATWKDYYDYPSIINFEYEKGKVLLIAPHLEIETNSNRDSTNFAEELDDIESDWELLETIVIWAISSETSVKNVKYCNKTQLKPNPASDYIEINLERCQTLSKCQTSEIKIFNIFGECLIELPDVQHLGDVGHLKRIDISHLPVGLYFIKIGNYTDKFVLVR
jgi:glutamine amidotransferase-like uncharacterized protein